LGQFTSANVTSEFQFSTGAPAGQGTLNLVISGGVRVLLFFVLSLSGTLLYAQTVQIKLVNGRSGSPLPGTFVNVWVGNERKEAMAIPTDENGVARLQLTDKDSEIDNHNRWNPVVRYNNSLRINVGYVLCQSHTQDYSWLALTSFSTEQVIQQGIVTSNSCGLATASPKPGQVIIFVRPLNWWEKLKQ
jgi:hypothetical protein